MTQITAEELADALPQVLAAPKDQGEINCLCLRPDFNQRVLPGQITLTRAGGIEGERWLTHPWLQTKVMIHSDQGSQFTSKEWQSFLGKHNLDASMSRRGNCHDNAVAESFFQLLKRERIRRRTYLTRDAARQDVFDYIEMFYNPNRKHTNNGMLSPVDYEITQRKMNEAGV